MSSKDPYAAHLARVAVAVADAPDQVLANLRPRLEIGAVYWVPDAWTRWPDSPKIRPAAIVRRIALVGPADIVLARPIQLSIRLSWKRGFGPPPSSEGARLRYLKEMHWLFTRAGLLPGWDRDGVFITKPLYPVPIWKLAAARFEAFMPEPDVALLAACTTGSRIVNPYPPEGR